MHRTFLAVAGAIALLAAPASAQEFKPLFNGKDLTGWDTYLGRPHKSVEGLDVKKNDKGEYVAPVGLNKDPTNVYTVVTVDGAPAIRVSGQIFGAFTSKDEFENYHLRFEVKWGEKKWPPREKAVRDSGVLYHCIGADGAGGGFWMKSSESQIQENDFGDFYSVAGVIVDVEADVKRAKRVNAKTKKEEEYVQSATYKAGGEKLTGWTGRVIRNPKSEKPTGEWNVVEIWCVGQTAVHVNNGKANMVLTNLRVKADGKDVPLTKGKLQFQSEGAEVFYRKIEIRPVKEIPAELLK